MLTLPPNPAPYQPIRASDQAAHLRYTRSTTVRSGPGSLVRTGGGGATVQHLVRRRPKPLPVSAAAATPEPFQLISLVPIGGDATGGSGYKATLQPGTINGTLFPKVSGTYMWQLVATTAGSPPVTTYEWPTLTVNKGDQVYLQGTVAAGLLTDVNVYSGAPPTESDTTTFQILGTCDTHTGAWTQLLQGVPAYQAQSAYFNAGARLVNHLWSWSAD